ncbi:MAG: type IV pilus assembly protein PilM [Acidobacteriota bacterium]
MKILNMVGEFFALDIGTNALNLVQLKKSAGGWSLGYAGSQSIDVKLSNSDAPEDRARLAEAIRSLIQQTGVRVKDVVLGVPSNMAFATVVDIPDTPSAELSTVVRYQAEQYVPMSPDASKIDWAVLGKLPSDPSKNEVLLVAVDNKFLEGRLDLVESLGLNVIAIEPDSLAITRALTDIKSPNSKLVVRFGSNTTDIVAVTGEAPKLVRALPIGSDSLTKAVMQNIGVDADQAEQFVRKFGLLPEKLEGKVFHALESTVEQFVSELTKSVKFFNGRYPGVVIDTLVMTDTGLLIPGLSGYITQKTGLNVIPGDPWARVNVSGVEKQKLQDTAATFAVAVGLAMREEN